jgi:hypothetical protein
MPVTYPISSVPASSVTFDYWRARTNELIDSINNDVLRAGGTLTGAVTITGLLTAGLLTVGGNTSISGILTQAANAVFTGTTVGIQGTTFSSSANAILSGANTTISGLLRVTNNAVITGNVDIGNFVSAATANLTTALILSGATLTEGSTHFIANTTIISALLSANADNYNPAGMNTASVLMLSADTTTRYITGFVKPATVGRLLYVVNDGSSYDLIFVHASGSSDAANRFVTPHNVNMVLAPGSAVLAYYSPGALRWYFMTPQTRDFRANVAITGDLTVSANATVSGHASITGTLGVAANVTIGQNLGVTNTAIFANTVSVTGAFVASNTVLVVGAATLRQTTTVNGVLTVANTSSLLGNVAFSGALNTFGTGNVSAVNVLNATTANLVTANVTGSFVGNTIVATSVATANVFTNTLTVTGASAVAAIAASGLVTAALSNSVVWNSKTENTVYQATSDGWLVCVLDATSGGQATGTLKTDASNPPTTVRGLALLNGVDGRSIMTPVKKGDYYLANTAIASGSVAISVYFAAFGTSGT